MRRVATCVLSFILLWWAASADAQEAMVPAPTEGQPGVDPLQAQASPDLPVLESEGDLSPGPPRILQGRPASRRPSPPPSPFKGLFYDNDFSAYVGKEPYVYGEELKLMPVPALGRDVTLSFGGQLRHRFHFEDNRLRPPRADENTFQLWRWRNYIDLQHPWFRIYVESIDADIFGEELRPLPSDRNRWDLLNAFADLKLYEGWFNGSGVFRYGRQELLYGAQRLISPLDWSNTRRNFHGYKLFHETDTWRLDAFTVNPVNAAAGNVPFAELDASFDDRNENIRFSGGWFTYNGLENVTLDTYYLYYDNELPDVNLPDGHRHTLGGRIRRVFPLKDCCNVVYRTWDMEAQSGYQFGSDNGQRVDAGFTTAVIGHTWNWLPWSPRLAGLFWYGTGDEDPNDGETNTYFYHYPLAHAYWGIIDNLAGQNLVDYSAQLSVKPAKKLVIAADYHWFDRASANDFLYNVAGAPLGGLGGSRDIGEELDIVATYTVNPNVILQAGYATFRYGTYVDTNLPRLDAEFFYFQSILNY